MSAAGELLSFPVSTARSPALKADAGYARVVADST